MNSADIFKLLRKGTEQFLLKGDIVIHMPCKICSVRFKIFLHAK